MKQKFKVFDSDMHVVEPPDLWQRYVDKEFASAVPHGLTRYPSDVALEHEGQYWGRPPDSKRLQGWEQSPEVVASREWCKPFEDRGWSGAAQIDAMDLEGIDRAVLYPSRGLFVLAVPDIDPKLAAAIARAYNNWLYDFMEPDRTRMFGAAMISAWDVDDAIAETRRAAKELGFKAVFLRSCRLNGRNWHDPYYEPLWAEIADLGISLGFHEASLGLLPSIGQYFAGDEFMLQHVAAHPLEQMLCVISICGGGVLERHPALRVAFLEGNCGWLPFLLWRMDEHVEWEGMTHSGLKMMPSEYFKRQCLVSAEPDEEPVKYVVEAGYGDSIVFSTDFPHPDSKFPEAIDDFLKLPLSDDARERILWKNCAWYYGFEERA